MDGMLPNLHGCHWERTKSSLCLMICTSFSRSQQVMFKIVGSGDICFGFNLLATIINLIIWTPEKIAVLIIRFGG